MKGAHDKHGDGRDRFAVFLRADVGGDRHLADVKFGAAHHTPERRDQRIDLLERKRECPRRDGAILERLVVALGACDGLELG